MSRYKCDVCETNHEYNKMTHLCADCIKKVTSKPQTPEADVRLNNLLNDIDIEKFKELFHPIVAEWRGGKPVSKLCYRINNYHMVVLDKMLDSLGI